MGSIVGGISGGSGGKNPMEKLTKPLKMLEKMNPATALLNMVEGAKGGGEG